MILRQLTKSVLLFIVKRIRSPVIFEPKQLLRKSSMLNPINLRKFLGLKIAVFQCATIAAFLRRKAAHQFSKNGSNTFAFVAFLGLSMKDTNNEMRQVSLLNVIKTFQSAFLSTATEDDGIKIGTFSPHLCDYTIGNRLGEPSSHAAVYEAYFNDKECALKMMFNYSIPSSSSAIMQAFYQEYHILSNPNFTKHPNIIKLYTQFVDKTPLLDDAVKSYPVALPIGSCSGAIGHKKTLFLVMPKYACTLNEYLKANGKTLTFLEQMHLLCQLFEAVSHLECNNIAHRDIKSNNILIDFCMKEPMLVLSDFGSCIEGMTLKFESYNICMGGSAALLSPEVISAVPGRCSILDYSKNDVWAAATLAYEIFNDYNPFYTTLSNISYEECNLPLLNSGSELVNKIVFNSLRKDRNNRLSAVEATTLLFVTLYTPHEWYSRDVSHEDVESWLVYSFVMIIRKCVGYEHYYQLPSPIKLQLTFFSRYSPECIIAALSKLKSLKAMI